jgi:hypothetical protein
MHRRTYLAALSMTAVAGCLDDQSAAAVNTTQPNEGVRSSSAPQPSTVLTFGEWHRTTPANVTVTGTSTTSHLRADASTPIDGLPAGTKLVIVSALLENAKDDPLALPDDVGVSFGVVASERLCEPVTAKSQGELSAAIETHVDESGTYLPTSEARLAADEQLSVWQAVIVPESLTTADVQIAMCDGTNCEIRWKPSSKTRDCPG